MAYHLSRLKARNQIGSFSLLVQINSTPLEKSQKPGQCCYDLYSLGSSGHSMASRTSTFGVELVIIILGSGSYLPLRLDYSVLRMVKRRQMAGTFTFRTSKDYTVVGWGNGA